MPFKDVERKREYQRKWLAANREAAVKLFGGACKKCGSKRNLQFDHKDPKKKISHKIWSWKAERRFKELFKCQLLCGECHGDKTVFENYKRLPKAHGHRRTYEFHGCRCRLCKDAHAESMRGYRAKC